MQIVPVELIETIVRDSFYDDPTTAKSVSLVCRHLQTMGQEMAFCRLKTLIPTGGKTGELLSRLEGLAARPPLLSYVTDLDLEVLGSGSDCTRWMGQHADLLEQVLDLVKSVNPLRAPAISGQWGFRDWMSYREGEGDVVRTRRRLYGIMAAPTIRSLDLIALSGTILHRPLPALRHGATGFFWRTRCDKFSQPIEGHEGATAAPTPAVIKTLHMVHAIGSDIGVGDSWDVLDYLADPSNTNILLHSLTN
jgi:hypothetical protein